MGGQWRPHELGPMPSGPCRVSASTGSVVLTAHGSDPVRKPATDSRSTADGSTHSWKGVARTAGSMPQLSRPSGSRRVDLSPRHSGGAQAGLPAGVGSRTLPPTQEEEG